MLFKISINVLLNVAQSELVIVSRIKFKKMWGTNLPVSIKRNCFLDAVLGKGKKIIEWIRIVRIDGWNKSSVVKRHARNKIQIREIGFV